MPAQRPTETFDNLRDLVTELEAIRIGLPTTPKYLEFSDDVFEELSRLRGGAVHKVRHKPTGIIMTRKAITIFEAPWKQLEGRRQPEGELSIASAKHINIVQWHGSYMSPSSSEIKILLEYCEGGSLEAVGMRIKKRGAIVGEKIAGRLAEGVCNQILKRRFRFNTPFALCRFCRALPTFIPKIQFTEVSNHLISSCLGKESSNSAISVFLVNS